MDCPTCGYKVRFLWKEGAKVFASPLEAGIQGAERLDRVSCDRCGGIFTSEGNPIPQDEEYELKAAMTKMWGEDRHWAAIFPKGADDGH